MFIISGNPSKARNGFPSIWDFTFFYISANFKLVDGKLKKMNEQIDPDVINVELQILLDSLRHIENFYRTFGIRLSTKKCVS